MQHVYRRNPCRSVISIKLLCIVSIFSLAIAGENFYFHCASLYPKITTLDLYKLLYYSARKRALDTFLLSFEKLCHNSCCVILPANLKYSLAALWHISQMFSHYKVLHARKELNLGKHFLQGASAGACCKIYLTH